MQQENEYKRILVMYFNDKCNMYVHTNTNDKYLIILDNVGIKMSMSNTRILKNENDKT